MENEITAHIECKNTCVSNIESLMHENELLNARCDELLSQNACHIADISVLNE